MTVTPTRLSDDLERLRQQADGRALTLAEIIQILHGRGVDVLMVLLALPFCTPIPMPGLSAPFGVVLTLFGARIALRKRPWLPQRLLHKEIPAAVLERIISTSLKVARQMEKILHPRLRFFKRWPSFGVLNGLVITLSGLLLALPLPPLPFTNGLPALAVVMVAAGMLEEDGAVIFGGYLVASLAWAYMAFIVIFGKAGFERILQWMWF